MLKNLKFHYQINLRWLNTKIKKNILKYFKTTTILNMSLNSLFMKYYFLRLQDISTKNVIYKYDSFNLKKRIKIIIMIQIKNFEYLKINLNRLIKTIISVILRGLIISLIYTEIPVIWDIDLYMSLVDKIGLFFGVFENKFNLPMYRLSDRGPGDIHMVLGLAPKGNTLVYGILGLLLCLLILILFILDNISFFILSMLGMVLVKAFMLNFYKKHFIFSFLNKKHGNIVNYLWAVLTNTAILKFLFKLWIVSIIMAIFVRSPIFAMLPLDNDSVIGHALAVTLPIPIFCYLLNFVIKYLKKEEIKLEDYYLYNDFVSERVNIYRIIYLICINYLIRHYYSTYIMIILFLIICSIIVFIYKLNHMPLPPAKDGTVQLHSKFELDHSLVISFISISPLLQQACNEGYTEYFLNKGKDKHIVWKKLPFSRPGRIVCGNETLNFLENVRKSPLKLDKDPLHNIGKKKIDEFKLNLERSPILNMAYRIKNNFATSKYQIASPWNIRPVNFFYNKEYYGFVSLAMLKRNGRFLVVCIVRPDLPGNIFVPSYHLPNLFNNKEDIKDIPISDSNASVRKTVEQLEYKYGISIPREEGVRQTPTRYNGLIIFTQAESLDMMGLYKVWRPSIHYTIPEYDYPTVSDYYHVGQQPNRIVRFGTTYSAMSEVKQMVTENCYNNKTLIAYDESEETLLKIALNEYRADRHIKSVIRKYLAVGVKKRGRIRDYRYYPLPPIDRNLKYSFDQLLEEAEEKAKASPDIEVGEHKTFEEEYESLMAKYQRFISNNEYPEKSKGCALKTRRDYSINSWIEASKGISPDVRGSFWSVYKEGVIEGFKDHNQTLGVLDFKINVPLDKSRFDLLKMIVDINLDLAKPLKTVYAVSVNRLTFEFFEVRFNKKWGSIFEEDIRQDGGELFSIVDLTNGNHKMPIFFKDRIEDYTLTKHEFNLFNDIDEHSIRRNLDSLYRRRDGKLSYQSHLSNFCWDNLAEDKNVIPTQEFSQELQSKVRAPKSKKVTWGNESIRVISDKQPVTSYDPKIITKPVKNPESNSQQVENVTGNDQVVENVTGNDQVMENVTSEDQVVENVTGDDQVVEDVMLAEDSSEDFNSKFEKDMMLAKQESLVSFNRNIMVFDDTFIKRGWLDTFLGHTHAKDALMAGPSGSREVYPLANNNITRSDNPVTDNMVTISDSPISDNIITIPDNPVEDEVIMISSDESSDLSSLSSDEDSLERGTNNLENSTPGIGLDETQPDLTPQDMGIDLGENPQDLSPSDVGIDLGENPPDSVSDRSVNEDNDLNRSVETDVYNHIYGSSDVYMSENDENEVVRTPIFLPFDTHGYDTDLHGHFWPPSPEDNVNSRQDDYSLNTEVNVSRDSEDNHSEANLVMDSVDNHEDSEANLAMNSVDNHRDPEVNLAKDSDNNHLDSEGDTPMVDNYSEEDYYMNSGNRDNDSDLGNTPVFLPFDPHGYDIDLHGHFWPPSPSNQYEDEDNLDTDRPM